MHIFIYNLKRKTMTKTRLFFQLPTPLNAVTNQATWICIREDLNFMIEQPTILPSVFCNVGMLEIETSKVEHFKIEIDEYMDIIVADSYSELMKINEDCYNDKFWEDLK